MKEHDNGTVAATATAMAATTADDVNIPILENARSVSHRKLPPVAAKEHENEDLYCTILLFYQYVEPPWSKSEHKKALKQVIGLANKYKITGRGRVAPEGVNCTLTGAPQNVRAFCYSLRTWNSLFEETDFKLTDGVMKSKLFKSLSIRKADELVAYGLAGEKAPSIQKFGGTHLEANEYHEAMKDPDAVIIDVRNAYESAIGGFRPPPTGAKLIDPKMRNSIEFPKWLGAKETQNELNGKKVLMYCTGGIRCERASALLNQMKAANPDLKPKGVYHCRGGIERYVKTFPGGGFWKGNNYLFDKRMEQAPSFVQEPTNTATTTVATNTTTESDSSGTVGAKCCLCRAPWSIYRGQFHCASPTGVCGVPVIVCQQCEHAAREHPERLVCELCRRGYRAPSNAPDLVGMKRRADKIAQEESSIKESLSTNTVAVTDKSVVKKRPKTYYSDRLFLRRLPLTVTATKIKKALSEDVLYIHWLVDKSSHKGFYGSCVVVLSGGADATERILSKSQNSSWATPRPIIRIDKKRIKVARVFCKESDVDWVSVGLKSIEYPPIGTHG